MIYPMMLKVDSSAIGGVAKRPKGLAVTLFINWLVKPFTMAFLGWLFMSHVFGPADGQLLEVCVPTISVETLTDTCLRRLLDFS